MGQPRVTAVPPTDFLGHRILGLVAAVKLTDDASRRGVNVMISLAEASLEVGQDLDGPLIGVLNLLESLLFDVPDMTDAQRERFARSLSAVEVELAVCAETL